MIPKERIFLKGDVMNALNIQKKLNTPKLGSPCYVANCNQQA
jgi:hypothetical protein